MLAFIEIGVTPSMSGLLCLGQERSTIILALPFGLIATERGLDLIDSGNSSLKET